MAANYPSGAAAQFCTHARSSQETKVTAEDVTEAFQKMWDCQDDKEFIRLHCVWLALKKEFDEQDGANEPGACAPVTISHDDFEKGEYHE
jgi:hypothetical protein